MNAKKIAIAFIALALLGMFFLPNLARGQTGIVVNNADSVLTLDTIPSQDLENTSSSVTPRNVVQYADSIRDFDLAAMPSALQTLANTVTPRNVVQYSDSIRDFNLATVPAALQSLVNTVTPRNVVQYSDSIATYALGYPLTLMNDTAPPQIDTVADNTISGNTVVITWNTDEFADSTVVYGTQSGSYPLSVSNTLLVKRHAITLTQLSAETTYFYQTQSTDRSGNTAHSSEYSLEVQTQKFIYLPLILK